MEHRQPFREEVVSRVSPSSVVVEDIMSIAVVYRSGYDRPTCKYCLVWFSRDGGFWTIGQSVGIQPGEIYIPLPWLRDL